MKMDDLVDDSAFSFGAPTLLETYQHHRKLLEAELAESQRSLLAARKRIAALVCRTDDLALERDRLRTELARVQGAR